MKKNSYCKKCNKEKNIKDFYTCNLSLCKDCKRNISKIYREKNNYEDRYINKINNDIDLLTSKINSIEIIVNEIYKCIKKVDETIETINLDNNFDEVNDTINKIDNIINNKYEKNEQKCAK